MVALSPAPAHTETRRYTVVAIAFHWIIAVLVIGELVGGKVMVEMAPTTLKFEIYQWHKSFGLTVLALSVLRLGWRLLNPPPPLPAGTKRWERLAAHATHSLFYLAMIGVPLLGWAMVSASNAGAPSGGVPTQLFGVVAIPDLPVGRSGAKLFNQAHAVAATAFGALVLLHIGAALRHHLQLRDGVLARMVPGLSPRAEPRAEPGA